MFENIINWYKIKKIERTIEALKLNGFQAFFVQNSDEALKLLLELIPIKAKVGIAGSLTIRQIGLIEALEKRGNQVIHHWKKGISFEESMNLRRGEIMADVFLTSSNAITEDGKLVNAGAYGNREAGTLFGKKVIVVAGINKIVKDVEEGIRRIKSFVAPINTRRIEVDTPCVRTGRCDDEECKFPNRQCNVLLIIENKPVGADFSIIMINQELGADFSIIMINQELGI
ncbi:MAG: lactate utilization protein [Candidatus Bathyarchaeia archaeon]